MNPHFVSVKEIPKSSLLKYFHTVLYNIMKATFSFRESSSPKKVFSWQKNSHDVEKTNRAFSDDNSNAAFRFS